MRIDLITISDGDKHLQSATDEYLKRLGKTIKLTQIKPTKHGSPQQIITADTDKLIKHLDKLSGQIVLLSKSGHQYTTEQRVELCEASHELTLIIGGPYGLDEQRLAAHISALVSLGRHTMPHGLAKLVAIEQLYRVTMINQNRSYHY